MGPLHLFADCFLNTICLWINASWQIANGLLNNYLMEWGCSSVVEHQTHIRRLWVRSLGEFSSPESAFCADSYFSICFMPCVSTVAESWKCRQLWVWSFGEFSSLESALCICFMPCVSTVAKSQKCRQLWVWSLREFSTPESTFCADSYFSICSTPVFWQ